VMLLGSARELHRRQSIQRRPSNRKNCTLHCSLLWSVEARSPAPTRHCVEEIVAEVATGSAF
jgi:hypothetical protein